MAGAGSGAARGARGYERVEVFARELVAGVVRFVVGEILDRDGLARGEGMVRGDREDAVVAGEDRADGEVRLLDRQATGHQVDLAAAERTKWIVEADLADRDFGAGVTGLEQLDDLLEPRAARARARGT
jgi:hypothetical protein